MSLITCKECGKEFSDQAAACPNCGCPNPEQNVSKSNALQDPASRYRNTNSNTEMRKKRLHRKLPLQLFLPDGRHTVQAI